MRAGWGTNHRGSGRCRLHGGASPVKHGRYGRVMKAPPGDLLERHGQDPGPLDLLPDLSLLRALVEDYVKR
jgi:hypothetical protein